MGHVTLIAEKSLDRSPVPPSLHPSLALAQNPQCLQQIVLVVRNQDSAHKCILNSVSVAMSNIDAIACLGAARAKTPSFVRALSKTTQQRLVPFRLDDTSVVKSEHDN
jgi:hypothetical protein